MKRFLLFEYTDSYSIDIKGIYTDEKLADKLEDIFGWESIEVKDGEDFSIGIPYSKEETPYHVYLMSNGNTYRYNFSDENGCEKVYWGDFNKMNQLPIKPLEIKDNVVIYRVLVIAINPMEAVKLARIKLKESIC